MNHDWASRRLIWSHFVIVGSAILQVEPFGQLEIELNRGALEGTLQCIFDRNVDLRAVESTIARVQLPLPMIKLVKSFRKLL